VGAPEAAVYAKAKAQGNLPPGPHNGGFKPDKEPTIRGGVTAHTLSVLELCAPAAKL
jgi:hypothetical protein